MTTLTPSESIEKLDAITGGAITAPTANDRATRIRDWLATNPSMDLLCEVFKELSHRDKGAARPIRERIDTIKQAKQQETIDADWLNKGEALLAAAKFNIADALAWVRDATKTGCHLSKEPLSSVKNQLQNRIASIEDLQSRIHVQSEAAILIAQRVEVLSTKSWRDAEQAQSGVVQDIDKWRANSDAIRSDSSWGAVGAKFPGILDSSESQLIAVRDAFLAALSQTIEASADASKPLPPVRVWIDEINAQRAASGQVVDASSFAPAVEYTSAKKEEINRTVRDWLRQMDLEIANGHTKAIGQLAQQLKAHQKEFGRAIDSNLKELLNAALVKAAELSDWQRWRADQLRQTLVNKAEALLKPDVNGQSTHPRKLQEVIKSLRNQWKQSDQGGGSPNQALWRRFDDACSAAHHVIETWLGQVKQEEERHRQARSQLIDELKQFSQTQKAELAKDWKIISRQLHDLSDRWRKAGHVGGQLFAELDVAWKDAFKAASAPLKEAQEVNLLERTALVNKAKELREAASFSIDAVKQLQERWKVAAQYITLDRKLEQSLWNSFREHLDAAFESRAQARQNASLSKLSEHDQAVMRASQAVQAAVAAQDAGAISKAVAELSATVSGELPAKPVTTDAVVDTAVDAHTEAGAAPSSELHATNSSEAAPNSTTIKKVVAVRGDDRHGMKKETEAAVARQAFHGKDVGKFGVNNKARVAAAGGKFATQPRLNDSVFRAQKEAQDAARVALRKLSQQAHGQAVDTLIEAWCSKDATKIPVVAQFGTKSVTLATRTLWLKAIAAQTPTDQASTDTALLRLEIAASLPAPAQTVDARRALQLQLLTQRNAPSPQETWAEDVAKVLASPQNPESTQRLLAALKVLVR